MKPSITLRCPECESELQPLSGWGNTGPGTSPLWECTCGACRHSGRRATLDRWDMNAFVVERPTWDQQFAEIAALTARRGTCDRSQVGCVITVQNRIVASGYNGAVAGAPHCDEVGHRMEGSACVRTVHAEANAIADAARRGVSVESGTAYVTRIPCINCAKLLVSAGILRVVCSTPRKDPDSVAWVFESAGCRFQYPDAAGTVCR